jgi:hypothetical protein
MSRPPSLQIELRAYLLLLTISQHRNLCHCALSLGDARYYENVSFR